MTSCRKGCQKLELLLALKSSKVSFLPTVDTLKVMEYSGSGAFQIEPVSLSQASAITLGDIKGYMTAKYDTAWWLGYAMDADPSVQEATVTFLHSHGPSKSFH